VTFFLGSVFFLYAFERSPSDPSVSGDAFPSVFRCEDVALSPISWTPSEGALFILIQVFPVNFYRFEYRSRSATSHPLRRRRFCCLRFLLCFSPFHRPSSFRMVFSRFSAVPPSLPGFSPSEPAGSQTLFRLYFPSKSLPPLPLMRGGAIFPVQRLKDRTVP